VIGVSASLDTTGAAVASDVEATGRSFTGIGCDLSDRAAVYGLVEALATQERRVDILVNNAGVIRRAPAAIHEDADWDYVLEVNLSAPFILTRELGKPMLERKQGKVIFTASLLSFQGGITVPGYAASKSGIAALAKAFANEWAASNVNVNAIAPGYMATDNTQALRDDPIRSKTILERIPAGRWGRAEDIAGAAVFLASAAADYIHGTVIAVDGGWLGR
jgi:2-deoxy-D-gluconate 3-dehydrogenase